MNDKGTTVPVEDVVNLERPGCRAGSEHDRGVAEIDLLSPLTAPRRHLAQPHRHVAHVPIFGARGPRQ